VTVLVKHVMKRTCRRIEPYEATGGPLIVFELDLFLPDDRPAVRRRPSHGANGRDARRAASADDLLELVCLLTLVTRHRDSRAGAGSSQRKTEQSAPNGP
jgi:hypothetical protein